MQGRNLRDVLFKVVVGEHQYVIYTDASIEGFGDEAVIINYYDSLVDMAIECDRRQRSANGISSSLASAAAIRTSDRAGAEHATPE